MCVWERYEEIEKKKLRKPSNQIRRLDKKSTWEIAYQKRKKTHTYTQQRDTWTKIDDAQRLRLTGFTWEMYFIQSRIYDNNRNDFDSSICVSLFFRFISLSLFFPVAFWSFDALIFFFFVIPLWTADENSITLHFHLRVWQIHKNKSIFARISLHRMISTHPMNMKFRFNNVSCLCWPFGVVVVVRSFLL